MYCARALVKRKINPKLDKHVNDEILSLGAKKAAVVLERKRLEFLQYLQEVQEEISGLTSKLFLNQSYGYEM